MSVPCGLPIARHSAEASKKEKYHGRYRLRQAPLLSTSLIPGQLCPNLDIDQVRQRPASTGDCRARDISMTLATRATGFGIPSILKHNFETRYQSIPDGESIRTSARPAAE